MNVQLNDPKTAQKDEEGIIHEESEIVYKCIDSLGHQSQLGTSSPMNAGQLKTYFGVLIWGIRKLFVAISCYCSYMNAERTCQYI